MSQRWPGAPWAGFAPAVDEGFIGVLTGAAGRLVAGDAGASVVAGVAGAASAGWLTPEFLQERNKVASRTALSVLYMIKKLVIDGLKVRKTVVQQKSGF